ncbi:MAG: SLC13 family permease [Solirubrobacteraceae bacterium]
MLLAVANLQPALAQAWPPFVLVAGLLLIGRIAGQDGLFEAAAARLELLPGPPLALLLASLAVVVLVSALLNLDTAAVFMTPVLIAAARRRGLAVAPFLYGSIFMTNAGSLFLPGSNLTNLLVLGGPAGRLSGGEFFLQMWPCALAAPAATAAALVLLHRTALGSGATRSPAQPAPLRAGAGLAGTILAALLIVISSEPALPVIAVALVLLAWRSLRARRAPLAELRALGLPALLALFALALLLGLLARSGAISFDSLRSAGALPTAAAAALASIAVNNLPAAVLLSAHSHLPLRPLLLGLDLGPNLAVTGSLSVLLWWRAAKAAGATPSVREYSRQGVLLAPVAILAGLLAAAL